MGILLRQEEKGKKWVISIREQWKIDTKQELYEIAQKLIDYNINCDVKAGKVFVIEIKDSKIKYDNYEEFKSVLNDIIDLKNKILKYYNNDNIYE